MSQKDDIDGQDDIARVVAKQLAERVGLAVLAFIILAALLWGGYVLLY